MWFPSRRRVFASHLQARCGPLTRTTFADHSCPGHSKHLVRRAEGVAAACLDAGICVIQAYEATPRYPREPVRSSCPSTSYRHLPIPPPSSYLVPLLLRLPPRARLFVRHDLSNTCEMSLTPSPKNNIMGTSRAAEYHCPLHVETTEAIPRCGAEAGVRQGFGDPGDHWVLLTSCFR